MKRRMMMGVLGLMGLMGVVGCKQVELVAVPQQHTEHHWHTDSVKERDSVYRENSTVIRELDSAAMAKYGIQLKSAERAWLVQSHELEARLRELEHMTARGDTVRDSIPVPYPVEVEKELTWWQKAKMDAGGWAILVMAVVVLVVIGRRRI